MIILTCKFARGAAIIIISPGQVCAHMFIIIFTYHFPTMFPDIHCGKESVSTRDSLSATPCAVVLGVNNVSFWSSIMEIASRENLKQPEIPTSVRISIVRRNVSAASVRRTEGVIRNRILDPVFARFPRSAAESSSRWRVPCFLLILTLSEHKWTDRRLIQYFWYIYDPGKKIINYFGAIMFRSGLV